VPHQGRTLHVSDPLGCPIEFCATMDVKPRLIVEFEHHRGAIPQRIDHFQLLVPDVRKACEFWMSLGFRLSEYISPDGKDDLLFVFLQRKGNPHDIVFAPGTGPRLHHHAFSIPESYQLFYVCDLAANMGFAANVEFGPGRHGPGHALFVYMRDPDGHRIEAFLEKPADPPPMPGNPDMSYSSMGNYVFDTNVLVDALRKDADDDSSRHDMGGNIIPMRSRAMPPPRAAPCPICPWTRWSRSGRRRSRRALNAVETDD